MSRLNGFTRRRFLRYSGLLGMGAVVGSSHTSFAGQSVPDLAVARDGSPAANCLAAVGALGGFKRFVKQGDRVMVKPNPTGTSQPEQALNTHPDIVAAVVRGCLAAGAADVLVASHDNIRNFIGNGIGPAAEEAGATVRALDNHEQYRRVIVPRGRIIEYEEIAAEVLDADVFINLPIAKHHPGAAVTLSMKNLMGVNWDRRRYHATDLNQCIAELASVVPQDLIILDATYMLLTNGPMGPGEIRHARQVIAGTDTVAMDAMGAKLFDVAPEASKPIRVAHELGIGEIDLGRLRVSEISA